MKKIITIGVFVIIFILGNVLVYYYDDQRVNIIGAFCVALSSVMITAIILLSASDPKNLDELQNQVWDDDLSSEVDEL